jgi:hypothetical protein
MDGLWANGVKAPVNLTAVSPSSARVEHTSSPRVPPRLRAELETYAFSFLPLQAIDTGTSLIYVPPALASAFYGLIPGSKRASRYGSGQSSLPTFVPRRSESSDRQKDGQKSLTRILPPHSCPLLFFFIGFWTVPCFSVKQIELSFGGYRFAINASDFYLGRVSASSTDCVGGVLSIGNGLPSNLAIIGDEFLKSCEFLGGVNNFGPSFTPSKRFQKFRVLHI